MKHRWRLLFMLSVLCAALAFGQGGLATLTGTVADQSGAVVANVPIAARHIDTGTVITGNSSQTGNFTISNLPIGRYEVTIELTGFKTYKRENIQLAASQVLRLEIELEVGAVTDSVTVTSTSSMMKTDTSAVVHNITVDQMKNLPLLPVNGAAGQASSNGFRDPFAIVQMLPGVRYQASSVMEVNGLPTGNVQFRLEGQVMGNARTGFEALTHSIQPSVDAIEEVSIQTSNFNAEFGSVGGAVFNVTMKSGTNQYHGSVYDYAVNEILNATDPGVHVKNVERRHDFGGTVGGPIWIPKIYDGKNKSFFFLSLERFQLTQVTNQQPTVPIQAYRDGDFSSVPGVLNNTLLTVGTGANARTYVGPTGQTILAGTLFDPNSTQTLTCNTQISAFCGTNGSSVSYRTPLLGNKLPASYLDPVALAIQNQYIPLPVGPNSENGVRINNYQVRPISKRTSNLPSLKFDHNINSASRISILWQTTNSDTNGRGGQGGNDGLPDEITSNRGTHARAPQYRVNYDHTLTPTIQFHLGAGYSMYDLDDRQNIIDFDPAADIGLNGVRLARNFPSFSSTVLGTASGSLGGMSAMGTATQGVTMERRPSGNASLTWIKGNHTIKGGAEWRMDMLPSATFSGANGSFGGFGAGSSLTWQPALQVAGTLSGQTLTGFDYANFLIGSVRSFSMRTPITLRTSKQQWGMYLQDTWRANRKLTVDIGIRWDMGTYTREQYGRNGILSLTTPNPSAGMRNGALAFEQTCNCNFADNYPYGIGPRLGLSYTINPKTVIRGGFGLSYGSTGTFGGFTTNVATATTPGPGVDIFRLRDGVPSNVNPQWPLFDANLGHANNAVVLPQTLLDPNAGRPSRVFQWNVSLQREITRNLVIEASYVANRGVWQSAGAMIDHNAVGVDLLAHYGFTVGNVDDANLLTSTLNTANGNAANAAKLRARGVNLPYSGFPGTQIVRQSLRPFPQYSGSIGSNSAPLGRSWYDSLQVSLNKRYSNGLMVVANYTVAKNLNANSVDDVFNWKHANKDLDSSNIPQQIRVSFEYQIPRPASYIPVLGNRWVSQAIGGWGVAMSLRYQGGFYIGRPAHGATNPISRWLGRGPGGAQVKRDADGNFMNPWSVNWTDYDGNLRTDPLDINCRCFDPEKTVVLNPLAWEAIPDGQWAASNQIIPYYRGPRQPQESGNLSRNFKFGRDGKLTLQVRVEFQNMFNRLLLPFTPLSAGQNFNTAPTVTSDGRYTAGFGTFGNLRANNVFGAERSGVFVGRFTF